MPRRGEDNLLGVRNLYNDEDYYSKRRKVIKCLCCCIFLFIVAVIIFWIVKKIKVNTKNVIHRNNTDDLQPSLDFSENLSKLQNENLCNGVSSKDTSRTSNIPGRIIYIIKGEKNLTEQQACGIESILRLFPDKTIYLIDFNKHEKTSFDKCSSRLNYLGLLRYLYKDRLELVLADKVEFFKNTPLQNLTNKEEIFEFMAMLLTSYKYGGFVASPHTVMTSRSLIECFPEETIVEPFAILTPNKCDDFLHYLMQSFSFCDPGYSIKLEDYLTLAADLYCKSKMPDRCTARRLRPEEICTSVGENCSFLKVNGLAIGEENWISDLSPFCKQVFQAYLGIKLNKMEVEEETSAIKSNIKGACDKKTCENVRNNKKIQYPN